MVDIEGRFDYNSWQESDTGRKLTYTLDKDVVLAEGYKEYKTDRQYMAKMGDWRDDKDVEIPLDGIGGVNIIVKADVHRSGMSLNFHFPWLHLISPHCANSSFFHHNGRTHAESKRES